MFYFHDCLGVPKKFGIRSSSSVSWPSNYLFSMVTSRISRRLLLCFYTKHIFLCRQSCSSHLLRSVPTFTTRDHCYHRTKQRWMTGVEKLSALGFPCTETVASTYRVETQLPWLKHIQNPPPPDPDLWSKTSHPSEFIFTNLAFHFHVCCLPCAP